MANKSEGGVKKGAWTKEEDHLLRKCIDKYGEGKWHRVPLRSGLNRCRQSCRLRWLNYLKPNLKRGHFTKDEVDLILRLHKLLGNRWSLIAGRLPGRTANDVKNFWNTHISRKSAAAKQSSSRAAKSITHSNIIRPRPRTLLPPPDHQNQNQNQNPQSSDCQTDQQLLQEEIDDCMQWWSSLLETTKNVQPFSESCAAEVDDGLRCLSVEALMSGTW